VRRRKVVRAPRRCKVTNEMRARALDRRGGEAQTIAPASACAWTAIEMVNDVYLLAGAADGSIGLFDLVRCIPRPCIRPCCIPRPPVVPQRPRLDFSFPLSDLNPFHRG
jgi:hypothetical protein